MSGSGWGGPGRGARSGLALGLAVALVGCGAKPATLDDLPVFPGAVELRAASGGDPLARSAEQDAAVRQAVGAGGQTRPRRFRLPAGTKASAVQAFYDEKLRAAGWESGAGGPIGGLVGQMLGAMTPADSPVRTVVWARGPQTLTAVILTGPGGREGELILSLATR